MSNGPPRRPKRPAKKLAEKGGRVVCSAGSGKWFARLGDTQATGNTEDEAAKKVLDRLDKG